MENERAPGLQERPTQKDQVLTILKNYKTSMLNEGWVDGMLFLRIDHPITQYHARIWSLQQEGHNIEGRFVEGKNWKEYRLVDELEK